MDAVPVTFVSVIIPVYNDAIRLKICLQALENQTYPSYAYEVIVVDNNSTESVAPIVKEFKHVKVGFESHPGSFAARNTGIRLSVGEILAFIDSDCIPALDWIERGVTHLLRTPNHGVLGGSVEMFFKCPEHPPMVELYDSIWHFNQKAYIERKHFSGSGNLFALKRVFEEVGYFAGNQISVDDGDDKEWGVRATAKGYPPIYAADVQVTHPARSSFEELQQKVRRVVKGNALLDRKYRARSMLIFRQDFWMGLVPPLITTFRLKRKYNLQFAEQLQFLYIWGVLKWIEMKTRISCWCGR